MEGEVDAETMGKLFFAVVAAAVEVVVRGLAGVRLGIGIAAAEATGRSLGAAMDSVVLNHSSCPLCYSGYHRGSVVVVVVAEQRGWGQELGYLCHSIRLIRGRVQYKLIGSQLFPSGCTHLS